VLSPLRAGAGAFSATTLFPGLAWYERETTELLGVYYYNQEDARNLVTSYLFLERPLQGAKLGAGVQRCGSVYNSIIFWQSL